MALASRRKKLHTAPFVGAGAGRADSVSPHLALSRFPSRMPWMAIADRRFALVAPPPVVCCCARARCSVCWTIARTRDDVLGAGCSAGSVTSTTGDALRGASATGDGVRGLTGDGVRGLGEAAA